MIVMFSKFLPGQRDSQLILESYNFTYSRKKDKDTPLNCVQKNIFKKFKKQYKADRKFARASRLVMFLAFVLIDFIDDAFNTTTYTKGNGVNKFTLHTQPIFISSPTYRDNGHLFRCVVLSSKY